MDRSKLARTHQKIKNMEFFNMFDWFVVNKNFSHLAFQFVKCSKILYIIPEYIPYIPYSQMQPYAK